MANHWFHSILKTLLPRYQTLHLEYPVDMKPRYGYGKPPHPLLLSIIDRNRQEYKGWLESALTYKDHLVVFPDAQTAPEPSLPTWNNGFLPGLDMVMLYTMFASIAPSIYLEIGSGHSTKVVAKAKRDHKLKSKIISLDPSPRAEIDQLADQVIREPLEKSDLNIFKTLKSGDIVFVDNSHRVFPNSDATVFFLDILPFLAPGVLLHVHDDYLPYDYPQWMCDRYYSEQYALASFLLANPEKYHTIMPAYYVSQDEKLNQILNPIWDHTSMPMVEKHGGSFWIRIQE
jgi:hypothetical protein